MPKWTILAYHRVGDQQDFVAKGMGGSGVPVESFRRQMRYLAQRCQVLPVGQALERVEQGDPGDKDVVSITFDDGYKDNHTHAWPVLKEYGLPATIFLMANHVGGKGLMWQHRLYCLRDKIGEKGLVDFLQKAGFPKEMRRFSDAMRWFKAQGDMQSRDRLIDALWKSARLDAQTSERLAKDLYLSWEEIEEMASEGIEFGSHTMTHPHLSSVPGPDLYQEVSGSRKFLQEMLGKKVSVFCYPYGDSKAVNDMVVDAVARAGYRGACTSQWGVNNGNTLGDMYRLRRKGINYNTDWKMWLELSGLKDRLRGWMRRGREA